MMINGLGWSSVYINFNPQDGPNFYRKRSLGLVFRKLSEFQGFE